MRWEDERYVKLYTRSTPEWTLLSWEARGVFCLLLREVDRAGILRTGKSGPKAIASALRMPLEVVTGCIAELAADGCIAVFDDYLVIKNFLAAQEARSCDAKRQREARARAKDFASAGVTFRDGSVTGRDETVTDGHTASRAVTTRQDKTRQEENPPVVPPPGDATQAAPKRAKSVKRAWPDGWTPSEAHRAKARDLGLDVAEQATAFETYHRSKGNVFADWNLAFYTWLGNATRFSRPSVLPFPGQRVMQRDAEVPEWAIAKGLVKR